MSDLMEIDADSFKREVLNATLPVVVDFYAGWCHPCKMVEPSLKTCADTYQGQVRILKVNVDNAEELASRYDIKGVPTLVFFKGGKIVDTVVGVQPGSLIENHIKALVGQAVPQETAPETSKS